jgi:REP element-mobilizing transposase RayT
VVLEAVIRHHGARYSVLACVVMDDHVHVVVHPMAQVSLTETVRRWKSYSANRLQRRFGRQGAVWQDEFFDRIIRDRKEFEETIRYVIDNPAKRWPDQEEYRWLWVDGWC